MRLAKYQDSKRAFDKAIQIKSDVPEAHNMRGLACANLLQHDDSISSFKEAVRLKPAFFLAHFNLAWQYRVTGRHDESLDSVDKVIQLKPDLAEAYSLRAGILEELGRTNEAVAAARQAVKLKPDSAEANLTLGWELDEAGQPEKALNYAQKAVQLKSDLRMAYTNICKAYNEIGRYLDALKACQDALARDAADPETLFYRAFAYERLGQTNNASTSYREAARAFEKLPEAEGYFYLLWGNTESRLGHLYKAIEKYKKAIHLRPNFSSAHFNIALTYLRLGRRDAALDELNILKTIDSAQAGSLQRLFERGQAAVRSTCKLSKSPSSLSPKLPASATLGLTCDADCTIRIDKGCNQVLSAGHSRSFAIHPGQHLLSAFSVDGRRSWQASVVLRSNTRQEVVVPIKFEPPSSTEQNEKTKLIAEIAQVRASLETNHVKVYAAVEDRRKLLEQRQARLERRQELQRKVGAIVGQIRAYESQIDQESAEASRDDKAAQQSYSLANANSGQTSTWAKIAVTANTAAYVMSKLAAEKHRQRAQQLLAQIDELSHELYVLTKP